MKISIDIKSGEVQQNTVTEPKLVVGIDLGTTHSLMAYIKDGKPHLIKDHNGHALLPSVIHFDENGDAQIGYEAKHGLIDDPLRTIYSVKRLLGRSYTDLTKERTKLAYTIVDNNDKEQLVKVGIDGKYYSPIELSALILKELKHRGEQRLGMEIKSAVITVPAYFNDTQRQATRDAGKLAGLDVLRIVNEPTAASLAYDFGVGGDNGNRILVYDLGGGTFDVTILDIEGDIFEVLATNGDTFLGGDDFDHLILEYWTNTFKLDGHDPSLRVMAEEAKKHLSYHHEYQTAFQGKTLSIDRATFEALSADLMSKTLTCCQKALSDANCKPEDIKHVVLVGGSTRMPQVSEKLQSMFEAPLHQSIDPDEVVVIGAAIQADILAGNNKDKLLLDVTPLSLGIETIGGLMDTIISRNTKIPCHFARNYTTSVDGQKNLKVAVFQGERDMVADNRKLGEFVLKDIPPMAAGLPKIEIGFRLDADGILKVEAKELRSGQSTEVEIRTAYGISEEEMGKMLLESLRFAEVDIAKRSLIETQNEAKMVVLASEKFIQQNAAILYPEEIESVKTLSNLLKIAAEADDKNDIQQKMDELNRQTEPLAHRALEHNVATAIKGTKVL